MEARLPEDAAMPCSITLNCLLAHRVGVMHFLSMRNRVSALFGRELNIIVSLGWPGIKVEDGRYLSHFVTTAILG